MARLPGLSDWVHFSKQSIRKGAATAMARASIGGRMIQERCGWKTGEFDGSIYPDLYTARILHIERAV